MSMTITENKESNSYNIEGVELNEIADLANALDSLSLPMKRKYYALKKKLDDFVHSRLPKKSTQ